MDTKKLKRVFKLGSLLLQDMLPDKPVAEAVKIYASNYPIIGTGQLSEGVLSESGDELVYSILPPVSKTKG